MNNFLRAALLASRRGPSFSSEDLEFEEDEDDTDAAVPSTLRTSTTAATAAGASAAAVTSTPPSPSSRSLSAILDAACPSHLLPIEVPLILACGTADSDVPIDMVEDFFWKAKEVAVIPPPPLSLSPEQSVHRTASNNCTAAASATDLTPIEKLNVISCNRNISLKTTTDTNNTDAQTLSKQTKTKKDDLTAAFVRKSTSLPLKLLKMPDIDHHSPVTADHPAFLKLYDELFVHAPSLADIPDHLDILQYHCEEVRLAMEYTANSNSNSRNSNSMDGFNQNMRMSSDRRNSQNNNSSNNILEHIFEDEGTGTGSSVGDASSFCRDRESSGSQSRGRATRQSRSSTGSVRPRTRSPPCSQNTSVDARVSDSLPMTMQLVDTVEMEVEKLLSYSSSEDGSAILVEGDGDLFGPDIVTTPNGSHLRKQRCNTQDSRDSGGEQEERVPRNKSLSQQRKNSTNDKVRGIATETETDRDREGSRHFDQGNSGRGSVSNQPSEDMEFFSFPAPINKSKRRSFILPKFM